MFSSDVLNAESCEAELCLLWTQAHVYLASLHHLIIDAVKAIHIAEVQPHHVGAFLADAVAEAGAPKTSGGFGRETAQAPEGGGGSASAWISLDYVEARAMPLLQLALRAANKERPEDPVVFLAEFLRNEAGTPAFVPRSAA